MLRYAILTLLADEPRSGYDLSKTFSASLTYVWPATQSQVYPELHRLEREGLVEATQVAQSSKPDKRLYRLSPSGRRALDEWIVTLPGPLSFRDAFQLRAFNFGRMDVERSLALLAHQKAHLAERIGTFELVVAALETAGHVPGEPMNPHVGWRLALEAGVRVHRAYLEWCDWAATQLRASAKVVPSRRSRGARRAKGPRKGA